MTSDEWYESQSLADVTQGLSGRVSDRKLRLFACAAARRVWKLIDTELHRRTVDIAEAFANDAGRDLYWIGTGNWATRKLTADPQKLLAQEPLLSLAAEHKEEKKSNSEARAVIRYDWATPWDVAHSTIHFRYDYAFYGPNQALSLETAPREYWYDEDVPLEFDDDIEKEWHARRDQLMPEYCDLFRSIYGSPDIAEP